VRLRLELYLSLLAVILLGCGCFSVDFQTRVGRRGGGTRTFEIVMDPVMAGMYSRAGGSDRVFNIPGQGLQAKPGVRLKASSRTEREDGSLKLLWDYQTDRLENFSDDDDSVKLQVTRSGPWVYYRYSETITPSGREYRFNSGQEGYRLRHSLALPGQVVNHNADSLMAGILIWNRTLAQVTSSGLTMTATSREINQFYLLGVVFLVLILGVSLAWKKHRAGKVL
jgi:hypothetical protein